MRVRAIGPLVVLSLVGCRSPSSVPEEGAVLLQLSSAVDSPAPDELRVWAYHDGGRLWNGARIPENGPLTSKDPAKLGTILIAPGSIQGALRIHIRALAAGERLTDGMLTIPSLSGGERTYDLRLETAMPADGDADGVPDAIDDCVSVPNPNQGGCAGAPTSDAGVAPTPDDAAGNPVNADDARSTWDLRTEPRMTDAIEDLPSDTNTVVKADTEAGARADTPADVKPAADVWRQDSGTDSSRDPVDLRGGITDVPADTAVAADVVPPPPDLKLLDVPQADACTTNCKKTQGELCANDNECASGFCADGVCCTNACAGPCRSCNQPDSTGICRGYTAGIDPEGECTGGTKCNGAGACGSAPPPAKPNGQLCGAGTECQSGVCKDGVCCNEACNQPCQTCGSGTCNSVEKADDIPECTGSQTCNAKGRCVAKSS